MSPTSYLAALPRVRINDRGRIAGRLEAVNGCLGSWASPALKGNLEIDLADADRVSVGQGRELLDFLSVVARAVRAPLILEIHHRAIVAQDEPGMLARNRGVIDPKLDLAASADRVRAGLRHREAGTGPGQANRRDGTGRLDRCGGRNGTRWCHGHRRSRGGGGFDGRRGGGMGGLSTTGGAL